MNAATLVAPPRTAPTSSAALREDGNPKLALATLPSQRTPAPSLRQSNATAFLVVSLILLVATIVALELGP